MRRVIIGSIVLDKTTFTAIANTVGNGFSITSEFATVSEDAAAATSAARIVYNHSNGRLFYKQNGSTAGFGNEAQFAALNSNPALAATDFVIQA
ncbi:hypothetical protein [Leptolyngbya ohadii]|uniref:hypothetical protein n=1 Tax=Leptolyngbya ohadii TaxID=1962290 RepID=UPI000B59C2A0|nr:hypothetical protein [Leptolyngbya ohadii]